MVTSQAEDGIRDHCVTGFQTCAFSISSRRRHTRSLCDWSSDVCSSDLPEKSDYFSMFEIPRKLWIEMSALEKKFLQLSWKLHPDNYVNATPEERDRKSVV